MNLISNALLLEMGKEFAGYADVKLVTTCDIIVLIQPSDHKIFLIYTLSENTTKPFNSSISFTFALAKAIYVIVEISNVLGQKVSTTTRDFFSPGTHKINYFRDQLPNEICCFRMLMSRFSYMKKMILLKKSLIMFTRVFKFR